MSPFDFLNSINFSKEWVFEGETAEKDYVPFVINRTLSYSPDAVLWANEINKGDIPKEWQYAYLMGVIPKKKRYVKWEKKVPASETVSLVSAAYKCSVEKAVVIAELLREEQVEAIKEYMAVGGKMR